MPVRIVDVDDGRGSFVEYSGIVTRDEMISTQRDHLRQDSEKFARYLYSLVDVTGVTDFQAGSETVRQLARWSQDAAASSPDVVVAVVVGSDALFGLTRMWELHMGDLA